MSQANPMTTIEINKITKKSTHIKTAEDFNSKPLISRKIGKLKDKEIIMILQTHNQTIQKISP